VPQVAAFLDEASRSLLEAGVDRSRIVWDAGIGFGKTVEQNFALLARQGELLASGYPLLAGWSRKSSLGNVTGLPVNERLAPSIAAAVLALERGAHLVRVHDVKETLAALKVRAAMVAMAGKPGMESQE
jgi:dihydropteroate synthase